METEVDIVDIEMSHEIGSKVIQFAQSFNKSGYDRVRRALLYAPPDSVYVEGIVVTGSWLMIEWAWIEHDGAIIDIEYDNLGGRAYFGAIKATLEEIKGKELPLFYQYGWGGMYHSGILEAWAKARGYLMLYAPHSVEFGPFDLDYDFTGFYAPPPPGFTVPGPRPGRPAENNDPSS